MRDEPHAAEIAEALAGRRGALLTTRSLTDAVRQALGSRVRAVDVDASIRRVFQALRIEVNDEFGALDAFLRQVPHCLRPGGRVAVLAFHSGEDRRVKRAFDQGRREGVRRTSHGNVIRASPAERRANLRASAAEAAVGPALTGALGVKIRRPARWYDPPSLRSRGESR